MLDTCSSIRAIPGVTWGGELAGRASVVFCLECLLFFLVFFRYRKVFGYCDVDMDLGVSERKWERSTGSTYLSVL